MSAVEWLIVAAAIIAVWRVHARFFPMKTCPSCKGSRKRFGGNGTFGWCGRCDRKGEVPRWGTGGGN